MFFQKQRTIFAVLCLALASLVSLIPAALAQNNETISIIPAQNLDEGTATLLDESTETHPPLKLTPDKSELIRLDTEAGSIIIGNPAHLNILVDSPKTLIAVPRVAGASHFAVLDRKGNIVMQRHVIVGSPKQKYVRVRRTCYGDYNVGNGCQPTRTYYCPDMCHEVSTNYEQTVSGSGTKASKSPSAPADDEDKTDNQDDADAEEDPKS